MSYRIQLYRSHEFSSQLNNRSSSSQVPNAGVYRELNSVLLGRLLKLFR